MSLEKLANANMKNRAEYSQLSTELTRLEKEKQHELRMLNNEIQRFKSKYSKTDFGTDSPEASNVKMYETHNPGFCFKRNGEHRAQQVLECTPQVNFEDLHFLLFTDGEVDIEKILCLHLLSSHETDHLTPPRRPRSTSKGSPLEQLIERSNDSSSQDMMLGSLLPTYVLDVNKGNPKRTLMDERLSARLLVNEKILELIMTVVSALEHSNPEKVQHLVSVAEDPSSLKKIFRKEHIQNFVMTLKSHSIVKSSFILTQPTKIQLNHIEIRTPSGALEDLIRFIRSNVLQFPKRESYTMLESESRELVTIEQTHASLSKINLLPPKPANIITKKEPEKPSKTFDASRFRRKDTNFIQKNIELVPTYQRSADDETPIKVRTRTASFDSEKTNESRTEVSGPRKSSLDSTKKITDSRRSSILSNKSEGSRKFSDKGRTSVTFHDDDIKVHLKQTKCRACMEKWRIPLPEPKVPRFSLKGTDSSHASLERITPIVKTNSRRRIQNLIEQEEFKLNSYDRRFSNTSTISNLAKKKAPSDTTSLDLVALNVLDLEKIRHEIREKETKKKLEKFLATTQK